MPYTHGAQRRAVDLLQSRGTLSFFRLHNLSMPLSRIEGIRVESADVAFDAALVSFPGHGYYNCTFFRVTRTM